MNRGVLRAFVDELTKIAAAVPVPKPSASIQGMRQAVAKMRASVGRLPVVKKATMVKYTKPTQQ